MGNALSMALRVRFRNLMDRGLRAAEAGKMLLLSPATTARWGKQVRDGDPLEPLPSVPRKGSGKPESFVSFFVELIGQDPDITLVELQAALLAAHGVSFSTSGIDALLRRHGYTYKNSLIARERDTPEVRKARHDRGRRQKVMREQPQRLIFLDETGTDTGMTREYGRSLRGERLKGSAPFRRWGNRTLIAGLSCDGIVAPWVISGALDRDAFDTCIEKVPIPELDPGSVVILDNLATHNSDTAIRRLKAHGCWFLFLPACSPDLNPIEMAFSKLKAHLRRIRARTFDQLIEAIGDICDLFTPDQCRNFFEAAGYAS